MSPDDRNRFDDRGSDDRGLDRGADDRNAMDRGLDRGADDRNAMDRGLDRGADRDYSRADDRGLDRGLDRGFEDRELEEQLAHSGRQARMTAGAAAPSPIYAAELRERLVSRLESERPPIFPFWLAQRVARVIPVSAAALLFAVAVVGASQLNIGGPSPSESPVAATDGASPTQVEPTWYPDASDNPQPIIPVVTPEPSSTEPISTPAPTVKPQTQAPPPPPAPTPVPPPPGPEAMALSLKPCDGGVLISWSKSHASNFNHYTTLRNTTNNVPLAYPPQGGAVDFGGTYTTDRFALSAADATGAAYTTYYYRTMAFNAADQVVGASSVVSAQALPAVSLGTLGVAPDPGGTLFTWTPYAGNGACFTYYKLVASTTNPNPSYLNGDPYLFAGSSQAQASVVSPDLVSGQTYYLRIQVIRTTALGMFVAAQSDVTTYLVP